MNDYSEKTFDIIKDIKEIKFYNTSFHEYHGIYQNFVVEIAPFAIRIFKIPAQIKFEESWLKLEVPFWESEMYHHIDSIGENKGYTNEDPCFIFENVTGLKIHTKSQPIEDGIKKAQALTDEEYKHNIHLLKISLINELI